MIHPTQKAVNAARNLSELCQALNAHEADEETPIDLEQVVDLCGLPTFGGEAPKSLENIWSWDAESVVWFENGEYLISPRN